MRRNSAVTRSCTRTTRQKGVENARFYVPFSESLANQSFLGESFIKTTTTMGKLEDAVKSRSFGNRGHQSWCTAQPKTNSSEPPIRNTIRTADRRPYRDNWTKKKVRKVTTQNFVGVEKSERNGRFYTLLRSPLWPLRSKWVSLLYSRIDNNQGYIDHKYVWYQNTASFAPPDIRNRPSNTNSNQHGNRSTKPNEYSEQNSPMNQQRSKHKLFSPSESSTKNKHKFHKAKSIESVLQLWTSVTETELHCTGKKCNNCGIKNPIAQMYRKPKLRNLNENVQNFENKNKIDKQTVNKVGNYNVRNNFNYSSSEENCVAKISNNHSDQIPPQIWKSWMEATN